MPKEVDEIVVGANGSVRVAPLGSPLPVGVEAAYAAAWTDLGYTSEDGVTARDEKTLAEIPVWQLFYPARRVVTARNFVVSFALRQWSGETVALAFGGGAVVTTAGPPEFFTYEPPEPEDIDERMLSIEWLDGLKIYRLHLNRGIVTENVETKLTKASAADLPITFGIIGEEGVKPWSLVTNDPAFAAA